MSQKTIALQLRTLAGDSASQSLLLKESSCLSGLVALLHADNDEEVLILSLQALQLLAAPPAHHAALVNQAGLVLAVTVLTDKPSIAVKTLAQNVLNTLEAYINGASATQSTCSSARRTPLHSRGGSRGGTRPTTPRTSMGGAGFGATGLNASFTPRYLQHVQFAVSSASGGVLDKAAASEVEKALVGIKGVVSVAYQSGKSAATTANATAPTAATFTLYTSHRPAVLQPLVAKALSDLRAGYSATLVTKAGSSAEADKENQDASAANAAPHSTSTTSSSSAAPAPGYLKSGVGYLKKVPTAAAAPAASPSAAAASSSSSSSKPGYLSHSSVSTSRALTTHTTAASASDSAAGLAARYQAAAKQKAAEANAQKAGGSGLWGGLSSVAGGVKSLLWS